MLDEIVRKLSLAEEFFHEDEAKGKPEGMRMAIRLILDRRFPEQLDQPLLDMLERMEAGEFEALVPLSATEPPETIRARLGLA